MALLEIKNLIVDYGIIRAIKGIDMKVEEGTIVAILGSNGAGKTTTIRTISGVVKAKSGSILFNGEEISNKEPYKIASLGALQSPEGRLILRGLTVEENLLVGAYAIRREIKYTPNNKSEKIKAIESKYQLDLEKLKRGLGDIEKASESKKARFKKRISSLEIKREQQIINVNNQPDVFQSVYSVKDTLEEVYAYFPVLKERKNQQASTLSGGEQQMLAIGRALMGRPLLLLLDEPSLGLAPLIVRDIFAIIDQIRKQGKTILIVEQNAYQTLKIADYAYVLELGKVKTQGKGTDLLNDEELVKAYLGEKKK